MMNENELLELLPKEAILELFKQRIVLTEDEFAQALNEAVALEEKRRREYVNSQSRAAYSRNPQRRESARQYERWMADNNPDWREKKNLRARKARESDPEKYRRHNREYYWSNRDSCLESNRLWREKNNTPEFRERKNEYMREYNRRKKAEKEAMKNEQD